MPEDLIIDNSTGSKSIDAIGNPKDQQASIPQLLRLIMIESTEYLRRDKIKDLKELTNSESEIEFLSNLRRVFKLGANEDGSFTVNDDLKKVLSQVANPESENLLQLLNKMGIPFNVTDNNITMTKNSFTKAERENLVETLNLYIDQKKTKNEMSFSLLGELESAIKHREQLVIASGKIWNDLLKNMASKVGK